jgi:RimJ/RimL family protein N-acetyltransferase
MAETTTSLHSNVQQKRGPAYRIETSRLCIRCWSPSDAELLKAAIDANLDYLRQWLPWADKEPDTLDNKITRLRNFRAKFDLNEDFVYGIFDQSETSVVGGTGLHTRLGMDVREIGYWIQEKHAGIGYATEVSAALTKVAFEVDGVKRVHIHCDVGNKKSARVPEKLGFILEGTLRKRLSTSSGELRDMMVWTMLIDDYQNSIPAKVEIRAFDAIGRSIL